MFTKLLAACAFVTLTATPAAFAAAKPHTVHHQMAQAEGGGAKGHKARRAKHHKKGAKAGAEKAPEAAPTK